VRICSLVGLQLVYQAFLLLVSTFYNCVLLGPTSEVALDALGGLGAQLVLEVLL